MNNTFTLQQMSQTGSLDSNLMLRQYNLDLMTRFKEIKAVSPKLKQDQIAKELGCPSSTLQRHRQDINMLSPYRISPKNHKGKQKISNREHEPERPQMTSKYLN